MKRRKKRSVIDRFREKIFYSPDGCWYWISTINSSKYGMFSINGAGKLAHRVSYELFISSIPENMCVCHTCDNIICVNPDHFFIGTNLDNVKDKVKKGRQARFLGSNHPSSKITEQDVLKIRQLSKTMKSRQIAEMYPIGSKTIRQIILKERWKHI